MRHVFICPEPCWRRCDRRALASSAAAQTGRVGGTVKDEAGQPIKGATITAENPSASPSSFTATTDDKGRFSIIGLRSGSGRSPRRHRVSGPNRASCNVQTIGAPNPPLTFTLKKGGALAASARSAAWRRRICRPTSQPPIRSTTGRNATRRSPPYRAIMAKAPSLSVINLQIAAAYRNKKEYDNAIAAYNELLKADPNNDKAMVGIGMTNLEKGDLKAAEETLTKAAAGRERRRARCSTTSAR